MKIHEGDPDEAEHRFNSICRRILYLQVLLEWCYIEMEISQCEDWNYLLLKKCFSSDEVDLAVLVVSVSSNSGK